MVNSRLSDGFVIITDKTPHFVPTALVRGYYISGHKAPQPVLSHESCETIVYIAYSDKLSIYNFYRTPIFFNLDLIDANISSASFLFNPAFTATAITSSFVGSMLSFIEVVW